MIESWNEDRTGWAVFGDDIDPDTGESSLRFRLGRSLDGRPLVVNGGIVESDACATFLMLNPSKATAFKVDQTINKDMLFGRLWGCDVMQAVNIHPLRSTDPDGLYSWTRRVSASEWQAIHEQNLEQIRLACVGAKFVIAAWGKHGAHLLQGKAVREFCASQSIKLWHLGLNNDGSPKHPLYRPLATEPQEWTL